MATTKPLRVKWLGDPLGIPKPPGGGLRRRDLRRRNTAPWIDFIRETALVLIGAMLLSVVIKTFLFQGFAIPSGSMEETLLNGDRVVVNKLVPGPFELHRGDIVVFQDPGGWLPSTPDPEAGTVAGAVKGFLTYVGLFAEREGTHVIKRVIGLPGDHVACCDAQGHVLVNGVPIDETQYLYPGAVTTPFDVDVPAGRLWLMGDNREHSGDSRSHMGDQYNGCVPVDDVVGVAFAIMLPPSRMTILHNPYEVFTHVPNSSGSSP